MLLGCGAYLVNAACMLAGLEGWLRPGDLFLFLAAGTLGLQGAVIATALGVIPETLASGESILALQSLALVCAIAWSNQRFPKIPIFVSGLVCWHVLLCPLLFGLHQLGAQFVAPVSVGSLLLQGYGYAILLLTAGCTLSNPKIWTFLSQKARFVRFPLLLANAVPLATVLVTLVSSVFIAGSTRFLSAQWISTHLLDYSGIMLLTICLPAILGWRVTDIIARNVQDLLSRGVLNTMGSPSFSGLSSDFWRRHSFQDVTASRHGLAATDGAEVPRAFNTPLSAPDQGICALNRNGTVTFVNRKFRSLCEVLTNNVVGKRLDTLEINRDICQHILQLVEESFKHGPHTIEVKANRLPDKLKYLELSSLRTEGFENSAVASGPDSIIIRVRDITDKRAIESHLLQSQKLSSLGSIVAGLAHSFNDSLTAITAQASLAKDSADLQSAQQACATITNLAKRAGSSVRDLLEFALGKPGLLQTSDLETYLRSKLPLLQKAGGGRCTINFTGVEHPVGAAFDSYLLLQALTAVVLNSTEALPQEGALPIEISLGEEEIESALTILHPGARPGKYARIRIKDSGCGMSAEVLGRACDPLFGTKSAAGHSGLGLSIVFSIVRAHDGFLTIESQPQRGTTISIYLPSKDLSDAARSENRLAEVESCPRGKDEKVLVVDDNEDVRNLLTRMLASLGYRAESCSQAESALSRCKEDTFDLLILDMVLPSTTGDDLALKVREQTPATKILKMTGGADAIGETLHKPFNMSDLALSVRATLDAS